MSLEEKVSKTNNSLFNSKLFFDLDNKSNDDDTGESDNSLELNEFENGNNNEYFLLNDLIKQLDYSYPISEDKKEEEENSLINQSQENIANENVNSIFSLNFTGYEFFPKNYMINNGFKNNLLLNNKNKIRKNNFKERKGDWICRVCNNLNFAFRINCNICKSLKENSAKKIIN